MGNNKMIKTAAAVALGASVVATAVAPGAASAATTYKLKSGKLVNAKTGKVVKGYKLYKSTLYKDGKKAKGYVSFGKVLYKNGKKFTGLRSAKYYKAGKLATGTYKGVYYKTGKKFTGLKSGVYYKAGVKGTGVYKSVYYKAGKKGTGLVGGVYYKNGAKGTGSYKGIQYKSGKAVTGVVKDVYYNNGVKATAVVDGVQYVDGDIANEVYKGVLYVAGKAAQGEVEGVLYKDGKKVTGEVEGVLYEDGKAFSGVKDGKVYVDGKLDEEAPAIEVEAAQTVAYGATAPTAASFVKSVTDNSGEKIEATATITFDGKEVSAIDTKVAGEYTINYVAVDKNGNEGKASVKVTVEATTKAEVESVTAINATQIQVKFSKAIDKATVLNGTTLKSGVFTFTSLDNSAIDTTSATGSLSEDGKTLTITAGIVSGVQQVFEGRYDITIDGVKTPDEKAVVKYEGKHINLGEDTTAPTIAGTKNLNASTVVISFSEPLKSAGSWSFVDATGKTVAANVSNLSADGKTVTVTLPAALAAGTEVTATVVGATDQAGNVIDPNPSSVKITKGAKDGVKPEVSSVTAKSLTTFEVKFSEDVEGLLPEHITVGATTLSAATASVEQDTKDKSKWIVTLNTALSAGKSTVKVANVVDTTTPANSKYVVDLSGEQLKDFSAIVDFQADTAKPNFVSSELVVDANTKQQQLVLTFDKDVVVPTTDIVTAATSKEVTSGLVTTTGAITIPNQTITQKPSNTKQLIINLGKVTVSGVDYQVTFGGQALVKDANYTLDFIAGTFSDTNTTANTSTAFSTTVKRGTDGVVEATKPVITGATAIDNNTIEVEFDKELDGATATNIANYSIPGLTIKSATLTKNGGTVANTVLLTLEKDTNKLNGDRVLTVKDVKAKDGVAMEKVAKTITGMKENVLPTVSSATLATVIAGNYTEIELTLSEVVKSMGATTTSTGLFEVYVGTSTVPVATTNVDLTNNASTKIVLSGLALTEAQVAQGITVKPKTVAGTTLQDAAGNVLDFTSIVAK